MIMIRTDKTEDTYYRLMFSKAMPKIKALSEIEVHHKVRKRDGHNNDPAFY